MTEKQTADFTAARILAVAARDAVVRLRDELQRQRPAAEDDDKKITAAIIDYSDYLIAECNGAIGAWTTTGDLTPPQPKYDPFADLLGETKCPLSDDPVCPTDQCPPQCDRYAGCGVKGRSDAAKRSFGGDLPDLEAAGRMLDEDRAANAAVELAKAIAKSLGVTVRVIKL